MVDTSICLVFEPARAMAVEASMPLISVLHQQVENSSSSSDNKNAPVSSCGIGLMSSAVKSRDANPRLPGLVVGFGVEVGVDGSLPAECLVRLGGVVFDAEVVDVFGEIDDGSDVVAVEAFVFQ